MKKQARRRLMSNIITVRQEGEILETLAVDINTKAAILIRAGEKTDVTEDVASTDTTTLLQWWVAERAPMVCTEAQLQEVQRRLPIWIDNASSVRIDITDKVVVWRA